MIKLLFIVICAATVSFSANQTLAQTVAEVGNTKISKAEFEKSYKQALANTASLNKPPTKEEHLEDMVRFKVGLKEAIRTNLKSIPAVKQSLELTLYQGLLEINLADEIGKIKVSDKEMKAYYAQNPQMRSGHIFIRLPEKPSSSQVVEAKKRADKIYSDVIANKKDWAINTRAFSDDQATKTNGGDLGYQSANSLHPSYYKTLKPLKVGEISPPVRGLYGFHIIKKTGQFSFERADQNAIKINLFNLKRIEVLDRYFEKLKKKHKVSYNKDLL